MTMHRKNCNFIIIGFVCCLWTTLYCGCSHTTKVLINVKMQSEIDIDKYANFAVLPFINRKAEKKNELGRSIAFLFRRYLGKSGKFQVLDTKNTNALLEGEEINLDTLRDTNKLIDLGGELGVDALIFGSYKFYNTSEPRRLYYDRYSTNLQRYVTDTVTYFHKTHVLSLNISIVDANTGNIVWRDTLKYTAEEDHNLGTLLISGLSGGNSIMKQLASQAASELARKIAPHYETEERVLAR